LVDPGLRLAAGDVEFVEFAVRDADNAVAYAKRDFGTAMWKFQLTFWLHPSVGGLASAAN
jgi:hypothetical protein